jgi:predicted metalloprotease
MSAAPTNPGTRRRDGAPQDEYGGASSPQCWGREDTWSAIFQARGARYVPPKLVLYRDQMPTACGTGSSAAGPFYCPRSTARCTSTWGFSAAVG